MSTVTVPERSLSASSYARLTRLDSHPSTHGRMHSEMLAGDRAEGFGSPALLILRLEGVQGAVRVTYPPPPSSTRACPLLPLSPRP
jgi:hypothetical protein